MAKIFGGIDIDVITDLKKLPQQVASAQSALETAGLTGASYKVLVYVGDQLVRGTNYWFIAEQTLVLATPEKHIVIMAINEYEGEYEIVKSSIVRII